MSAPQRPRPQPTRQHWLTITVLYITCTGLRGNKYILLPSLLLQMMTAAEETEGGVFISELVIGVTTSRCPLQMMTAVQNNGCVYVSELVTGVTTSRCPLLMMTAVQNNGCVYVSELVTGVTTSRCPLLMMTAVEKTGSGVFISELVTGVTTSQCCRWVSPHNTH